MSSTLAPGSAIAWRHDLTLDSVSVDLSSVEAVRHTIASAERHLLLDAHGATSSARVSQ